jgi:hypothetical protein
VEETPSQRLRADQVVPKVPRCSIVPFLCLLSCLVHWEVVIVVFENSQSHEMDARVDELQTELVFPPFDRSLVWMLGEEACVILGCPEPRETKV